jgi:transcription factor C subunit 7
VPLTAHGVEQARELAAHLDGLAPPIERVYSSPYYRCLQTVEPFVRQRVAARAAAAAAATGSGSGSDGDGDGERLRIRPETGLAEWYGSAPFEQPRPAPVDRLRPLFPGLLAGDHAPLLDVPRRGETMAQLHARVALALGRIVDQGDAEGVRAVLLCSHAAAIIAMGRVLTGRMPPDPDEDDFRAFTCGLSMYRRRRVGGTSASSAAALVATGNETRGSSAASAKEEEAESWRDGRGVRGGWDVLLNSDCSFLTGGEERGWCVVSLSVDSCCPTLPPQPVTTACRQRKC